MERFSRTINAIGEEKFNRIKSANVAVFGLGGVGGYVVEGLARSGVGKITVVDFDLVGITNLNRQIIALSSTVGKYKSELVKERVLDINPNCEITALNMRFTPENSSEIDFLVFDYVVDAVDDTDAKTEICLRAVKDKIPVISCMGTANHLDPSAFKISDLYSTSTCPLARKMRALLKKEGVEKGQILALYSTENPLKPQNAEQNSLASTAFCPSVAGLLIAHRVITDISQDF